MVLYSEYSIKNVRKNNKKYLITMYFLMATIMISVLTISGLSVLNYSINYTIENKSVYQGMNSDSINDTEINKFDQDNSNNYYGDIEIQKNYSCAYCKDLINIINLEYEKYGKTIEDIVDIIKNICTLIHAPVVSQECIFISNNIEKILNWTSSGMNSTLVCRKLHLCDNIKTVISK